MKTVSVEVDTLKRLIRGLEEAVNVCYNVNSQSNDVDQSPYYAVGYSRGAMEMVIDELNHYKSQKN